MPFDVESLRHQLIDAVGDQFEVGPLLGRGGSAAVFRARDPVLNRDVAIKVIAPSLAATSELHASFLHEAQVVASVEHPHIVPVFGAYSRNGLLFLVMRLLDGRSLTDRLRDEGPLAPATAARIAHEVAQALAAAHARGVIHRDIKPDNVLLDHTGRAYVTDFGIAQVLSRASAHASADQSSGTPGYMSPEQLLGEAVDGRTDVYATGVLLFEMLCGRPPFVAGSIAAVLAKHMTETPPALATLQPETPLALEQIVTQCLAKSREDRPDAHALVARLLAAQTPQALRSPALVKRVQRRRRTVVVVAISTAAVALLALLLLVMWRVLSQVYSDGAEPAINAFYEDIPPAVIDDARTRGALTPGERVVYAFRQAGDSAAATLLVTSDAVIRLAPTDARRLQDDSVTLDISRTLALFGTSSGVLVARYRDGRRDTVLTHVTGVEAIRLGSALATIAARVVPSPPPAPTAPTAPPPVRP